MILTIQSKVSGFQLEELKQTIKGTKELKKMSGSIIFKSTPNTRGVPLDPAILNAIITGGSTILGAVISVVLTKLISKHKVNKKLYKIIIIQKEKRIEINKPILNENQLKELNYYNFTDQDTIQILIEENESTNY